MKQRSKTAVTAAPTVDILVQSPLWERQPRAASTVRRAVAAAAAATAPGPGEVSVVLTDDAGIRALNREWRKIDKPTNVLSFPGGGAAGADLPRLFGDIVIAFETIERESSAESKPFLHRLAHLAVHGFLHLIGYDHENDADAESMEGLERRILARLKVPDPYRADKTSNH